MTDVAERRKRDKTRLAAGARPSARSSMRIDRTGCAHFRHRTVQHSERLDDPDPAGRRLPLRVEILLRLQQAFLPFFDGLFSGRNLRQPPERGDVAVFKYPATRARVSTGRTTSSASSACGRSHPVTTACCISTARRSSACAFGDYVKGNNAITEGHALQRDAAQRRRYTVLEYSDDGPADNTPEFLVPAGNYFVMATTATIRWTAERA